MARMQLFTGISADGTKVRVAYGEDSPASVALALLFAGDELPRLVYWGRPLPYPETLIDSYAALRPQRVSGALDETSWPTVLPTQAEAWSGAPRFVVRRGGVELFCKFAVEDIAIENGPEASRVTLKAADREQGVGLTWTCELVTGGLIRQRAIVENVSAEAAAGFSGIARSGDARSDDTRSGIARSGDARFSNARSGDARPSENQYALSSSPLEIDKVELGFALPAQACEILTTTGHHLRERSPQRQPFNIGRLERLSLVGRPDFDASLLLVAGVPGFGFERGESYAVHVGWSGNSALSAERLPYTQGVIGGGERLFGGEITLETGQEYSTPWVYGSYGDGLNEVASRFHAYVRSLHPNLRQKSRPVILNTWEAVYFDQNYETLRALADKAAAIGVERFVVDDGWFGSRRDDTSGLGDWQVSKDIWPDGPRSLKALSDYVHGKGMEFGLWFEPEMANPDSNVVRNHPDWLLRPTPGRLPMQGRSQQTLDLSNPETFAYIFEAIDKVVADLKLDYIKWDHNKYVTEAVSPYSGRPAVHAQTLAVYRMFRDLKANHPGLEIESCASGGGRIGLGILALADRVWVSDCVDPLERADIQRYTSLLVPPEMMGEHVGASPAHSTGRVTSQELRQAMAFFGHMGVEWNLLKEPEEDVEKLGRWIAEFKRYRDDFATGFAVHGDAPDSSVRLDGVVSADRSRAVYRFTQVTTSQVYPAAPVRLPGLDSSAVYHIRPLPIDMDLDIDGQSNGQTPLGWWNEQGITLPATSLEAYGIRPPSLNPAQAVLFLAECV
ncbi:alpha-galactosidase [Bifidobacterium sp. ESL0704]|uniref:alpha-galactosidase n=1 Tax=Bifidobacterium sp. ESL0704 TaxID=2983219 RepID=UPI0023F8A755|nr:alpha-galactosidase [Bifidobacterium sp. ESL0704]WEV53018.1 alpha-galactosidase [Bifidobacterium sp. ESL0704]